MKVLIISYYFTPSTVANAKRPFLFARGFLQEGWDVEVISSSTFMPEEYSELIDHPKLLIQRIKDPINSIGLKLKKNRIGRILFSLIRSVLWPDISVLWVLRVAKTIDFSKYDKVLVSILPASMIFLGWIKKADSSWIFDYQETVSPSRPGNRRSPIYKWLIPLYTKLQRTVLRKTNYTVFSTESYIKDYIQHNLIEPKKAIHIPLFYDDMLFNPTTQNSKKFIISYFGNFQNHDKGRSPEVFLQTLQLFLKNNPKTRKLVEFRFYGSWIKKHNKYISELRLQDVVKINPAVPYKRYIKLLSEASVLLLVTCRADNLFVPSKMMDYFGAQRPIFGFIPSDSETYEILKVAEMTHYVSQEMDVKNGIQNLEQLWKVWADEHSSYSFGNTKKWSASVQVKRMIHLLSNNSPDF